MCPRGTTGSFFDEGKVSQTRPGEKMGILVTLERKEDDKKTYTFKRIVRVTEQTMDKQGRYCWFRRSPWKAGGPISIWSGCPAASSPPTL